MAVLSQPPAPPKEWNASINAKTPDLGGAFQSGPKFAYDPLPTRYYVVEQIKNSVTGQIWYVGRSTLDLNDGFIPTNDFSLNAAISKNGKAKMIKTQVGTFANAGDVTNKLSGINSGIVNIKKVSGTGGTVPLPSIIVTGL
jgi:hypothetical protein